MPTPCPLTVSVPATMANLGPGFDSFGLALSLVNRFHVTPAATSGVSLHPATCVDFPNVPSSQDSLMHRAMAAVFQHAAVEPTSCHIAIEAHVPVERGLGSSSTAIVAGLLAANAWLDNPLPQETLLQLAHQQEGHPDNVAPALLGGVQLCHVDASNHVTAHALPWPEHWQWVVVVPHTPLATHAARQALPKQYPLPETVSALQHAALWVHAVHTQNACAMAEALSDDTIHHPYRGPLIPLYAPLMAWCKQQSLAVIGGCISGAGSTLGILVNTQQTSTSIVAQLLKQWLAKTHPQHAAHVWPVAISPVGSQVLATE